MIGGRIGGPYTIKKKKSSEIDEIPENLEHATGLSVAPLSYGGLPSTYSARGHERRPRGDHRVEEAAAAGPDFDTRRRET